MFTLASSSLRWKPRHHIPLDVYHAKGPGAFALLPNPPTECRRWLSPPRPATRVPEPHRPGIASRLGHGPGNTIVNPSWVK